MQHVQPIMVVDLFPQERRQLLLLFSELEAKDWEKPTICPGWSVKDIGLHLLGDDIGYLSRARDQFSNPFFQNKDLHEWKSLVKNINEANELWVKAAARLSPKLLADLLELTGRQFHEYVQSLLGTDAGEIADREWSAVDTRPRVAKAFQVEPGMDDVDAFAWQAEVACHEVGIIMARGDEAHEILAIGADEFEGSAAILVGK